MNSSIVVIEVYYAAFGANTTIFLASYRENLFRANCTS